ncbi:MAG: signal peptidase I [Lachnospiraceae bacterium]|nr:signal peptidase I [Lachnospiraceae bacterium]
MARHKGLSFYRRKKKISSALLREIFSWMFGSVVAVFIAVVLVYFFGMTTYVVGTSMDPALRNGQKVLIDRFAYVLSNPHAGDVIAFWPNGNKKSHHYVKRVVAGPGDEVLIENGILYVNGEKSPFEDERILDGGIAVNPLVMGKGEYFCIGDNVNNSEDSRSANIGAVKDADIIGKIWFRYASGNTQAGFVK